MSRECPNFRFSAGENAVFACFSVISAILGIGQKNRVGHIKVQSRDTCYRNGLYYTACRSILPVLFLFMKIKCYLCLPFFKAL